MKKLTYIRMARQCYTDGLTIEFDSPALRAVLLTNRAAMNLILGNNRQVGGSSTLILDANVVA